jgi:transketolase
VAENNMLGVAAGLALAGKIPFACSFAAFSPAINWAVIRQSVCLNQANVKIVSSHAGLLTGADGASHQALEDLALMQVLPKMTVVVPADFNQAYTATLAAAKINGPLYLRLTRPDTEQLIDFSSKKTNLSLKPHKFQIGKCQILKEGKDLTIISCGPIIFEAIKAINQLSNLDIELINCHTLKPLDKKTILNSVKKTKACLTLEDHQVFGGLGASIAMVLAQNYPVPLKILAVEDRFGESARKETELIKKFNLDNQTIIKEIKKFLHLSKSNDSNH